jgi:hydrogenase nickel incorporation protein HypA/HybF
MHETSVLKSLLRGNHAKASEEGARRVIGISVWLGALTDMTAEHFIEHFQHASAGTLAEGAHVDVTVSDDVRHPNAQHVVLQGLEVET